MERDLNLGESELLDDVVYYKSLLLNKYNYVGMYLYQKNENLKNAKGMISIICHDQIITLFLLPIARFELYHLIGRVLGFGKYVVSCKISISIGFVSLK